MRAADLSDLHDIFEWRNDPLSRSMSRCSAVIAMDEHSAWYRRCLVDRDTRIYIGEVDDMKIGVVYLVYDAESKLTEVSINLNPMFRGRGYGQNFLSKCIEIFDRDKSSQLTATIRKDNNASTKIFTACDFSVVGESDFFYFFKRFSHPNILKMASGVTLRRVTRSQEDVETLYELLKKRKYNITNIEVPAFEDHALFVNNHPYRIWYMIMRDSTCFGSVYIMDTNCIGITLMRYFELYSAIMKAVMAMHKPLDEIKSVRPPFFFVNISPNNRIIKRQLSKLRAQKLQVTYRLFAE